MPGYSSSMDGSDDQKGMLAKMGGELQKLMGGKRRKRI